ncbi:hypothetical protein L596_010173 [Steinernema carpocapsae]|uniref:Uncharacterized protein n=1 Tax=Steinernema carpocapsae TaxID=34508 RepID=A0A4U5PHJ8_STECR|nr:hypothetical protein L596_010173 [Steinernema carpocapsae]
MESRNNFVEKGRRTRRDHFYPKRASDRRRPLPRRLWVTEGRSRKVVDTRLKAKLVETVEVARNGQNGFS